ncbi:MAG TPA: hypothetical protein VFZ65_21780 [Planctomycetota bacterium]|nr:hypothetical protein [Planctomycetota bacterium]
MNHSTIVLPLLLCTGLAAQRVVVVDAANGPGTDYTTLADAFAGLQNNDFVLVRAGTYTGLSATTGLSFVMVGEGDPTVEPAPSAAAALTVTMNGSSYQRIAFRGMTFHSLTTGQWALNLRTNYNWWPAPTAEVEDCTIVSQSPVADRVSLLAESIGLTLQRCTLGTSQLDSCLASIVACTITGPDQSMSGPFSQHAQTALDVIRSEVWIVDSTLTAGNSNNVYGSPASCIGFSEYSYTVTSTVHVSGACTLTADQSPNTSWPAPFVFQNYQTWWPLPSAVDLEPGVALVASPPLGITASANVTIAVQTVPHLQASAAPLGGAWTCTAHGTGNDVAILVVATASRGNVLLGMPLLMDTAQAVIADFGVVAATGSCTFAPIPVPNDPLLFSTVLQGTGVFLTPSGLLLGSNPVSGVLH